MVRVGAVWKTFDAAIFLAQDVVGGADIEQQHAVFPRNVSDRQQLLGGDVGQDVAVALGNHLLEDRARHPRRTSSR